ncbi:hypothetical protein [Parafilimonas terrae]|uniref:Uncharacterized protein n=1 Tax=Parafilimonas terrae TaxID=1465490 RepID=A0A1I5XGK4_9BACT|nr:hypothetical protein [Parafilimonas terrae]SFQ30807.1 hypothetical protein SAMN05444277_108154 [Parafilimonas terrae]
MVSFPHISVNKLGEYVYATPAKKRSILKTMKYPSSFKLGRYPEPQSAFIHFMADEKHDIGIFEKKKQQVAGKKITSDWVKTNIPCCLEALDHLINCSSTLLVPYLRFNAEKGLPPQNQNTTIQNVIVHIKPEVVLLDAKTKEIKGAIKLVLSKTRHIDLPEANIIAASIKNHLESLYKIKLKPENCIVIDVFHRRKYTAPKFIQTAKMQIKLACNEILTAWPTITD